MSRQNLHILIVSTILLIAVVSFSFLVLIPKGQKYRVEKNSLNKIEIGFHSLKSQEQKIQNELSKIEKNNERVIKAYKNNFDIEKFKELNKTYFDSLEITKSSDFKEEDGFSIYEVNATSNIESPKNFYDFLDTINSSEWIILVNFPINFKRDEKKIKSSFTMRVYNSTSLVK